MFLETIKIKNDIKMNDSFLYHAFGLYDMQYCSTFYKGKTIIITIKAKEPLKKCPECGSSHIVRNGVRVREFHGLPIGGKNVVFRAILQRYRCQEKTCSYDRQEDISFADGSKSYIKRFVPYVVGLLKIGTIKDVANKLGVGWDTIKDIHKAHLNSRYKSPSLKGVRHIGIDEFAVRKGHVYKTIVMDLDTGRILHVGDGKGSAALAGFWKRIRRNGIKIEVVTMDMSSAFFSSVKENIPEAAIVFDHFHVVKLVNEAVDKVRRAVYNKEKEKDKKKARAIKGIKWLLLGNHEEVSDKARLDKALDLNNDLFFAYYLKEDLREIWCQLNKENAETKLTEWVDMARATGIPQMVKVSNTIMAYKTGILNWYDHHVSNAKVEGTNNKIKVLKRVAYGFRDDEYFKLRLFALHDCHVTRNVG